MTKPLALRAKSLYPLADTLPSVNWRANAEKVSKYKGIHKNVGAIYDSSVCAFLRMKGIQIPPPRSEYHWEELFNDQFFNYWKERKIQWDEEAYSFAFTRLVKKFSHIQGLVMASLDQVGKEILTSEKATKSSGLPHLSKKAEVLDVDTDLAIAIANGRVAPPPAIAYYRTQVNKVRLVWGLPLSMILLEGQLMVPITEALKRTETPYVMGYTSMGIAGRINELSYCPVQFCLDWSKFDSTVPHRIIHSVFRVIKSWFTSVDETAFEVIVRNFCTCPILMPDLRIYKGRVRGIPSGSWFTQLVGSMCNLFLTEYISYIAQENIQKAVYLGDDSVLGMDRMPNLKNWERAASVLGMTVNSAKQVITHGHPHFLGHDWGGMMPVRPLEETIQRLATMERYVSFDSKLDLLNYRLNKAKALMIDNPSAYDFLVEYIKFLLGFESLKSVYTELIAGQLTTGTPIRLGWQKAEERDFTANHGVPVTFATQMLRR